ncbi:MAG: hypothetical protein Q9209_000089 [Squamulea sp. 1 TL-2023]
MIKKINSNLFPIWVKSAEDRHSPITKHYVNRFTLKQQIVLVVELFPNRTHGAFLHTDPEPPVCSINPCAKWYAPYSDEEKIKLKGEVHRLIAPRDQKHQSNFVEFRNLKIVYRRYAGLFFCVCVDANDNELAYLEAIHFFVEVLDSFFGNVCELDLVFNFYKVYAILDEVFLAGEIEETSKQVVLSRLEHLDKLE